MIHKTKLFGLLLTLSVFTGVQAQQKFTIQGNIEGLKKDTKILLTYRESSGQINDTTIIKGGKFTFEGTIERPRIVHLILDPQPYPKIGTPISQLVIPDAQMFYLEAGTTIINTKSLKSAVIDNPTQKAYLSLEQQLKPLQNLIEVNEAYGTANNNNKDSLKVYRAKRLALYRAMDNVRQNFVIANPNSYVSFDYILDQSFVISDPESFDIMYEGLSPDFKNSADGQKVKNAIALSKKFAIGQRAIEFTQSDTSGKSVSLASLKGKYVLIDFWASWCGPCRGEYPYLHKAYDKFKGKNFEIIGVSLDDKRDLWTKSIKSNNFTWLEVCDLKGHQNEVVKTYGITAIPQSLLLDPQGFIIAKNLRGDDLVEKLDEIIDSAK